MDVDFDSPVNVERPPPPLSFSPDSHEPALSSPVSPPPTTLSLPPLDPTNQHNNQLHQPSHHQPTFLLQPVQPQVDEAPTPAATTDTTAPERPAPTAAEEPVNQNNSTPAMEATTDGDVNPATEAAPDSSAMDTTPDNTESSPDIAAPNDTNPPADSSNTVPEPPQETSASESQPPPPPPTDYAAVNPHISQDSIQDPVPPPEPPLWNNPADQAEATNADVDDDDSCSEASQDDGDEKPAEEHAYWADIEEDTSTPDEAELKEIEAAQGDYSAKECRCFSFTLFFKHPA